MLQNCGSEEQRRWMDMAKEKVKSGQIDQGKKFEEMIKEMRGDSEFFNALLSYIRHYEKGNESFQKDLEACTSIEDIKKYLSGLAFTYFTETIVSLRLITLVHAHAEILLEALDKLPNKKEFDDMRAELEHTRGSVVQTL